MCLVAVVDSRRCYTTPFAASPKHATPIDTFSQRRSSASDTLRRPNGTSQGSESTYVSPDRCQRWIWCVQPFSGRTVREDERDEDPRAFRRRRERSGCGATSEVTQVRLMDGCHSVPCDAARPDRREIVRVFRGRARFWSHGMPERSALRRSVSRLVRDAVRQLRGGSQR